MIRLTENRKANCLVLAICALFLLIGQFFIPLLGYQNDESLFSSALMAPRSGYIPKLGHLPIPLMLMDYLGTLKAWLYAPVFALFGTGVWSFREPALLAGAASIWVFYLLLRRVSGRRAAVIGAGLLGADAIYLLTSCFDWGPVALQHLLITAALLVLVKFYQSGSNRLLAAGFFLLGLAMWDKALAAWALGGIGVAALAVFPRHIFRVTTFRRLAISTLFFLFGALPLVVFNCNNHFATFRGKGLDFGDVANKAQLLRLTADGTGLMGWMVYEDGQDGLPRTPMLPIEHASEWVARVARVAGLPRTNLMLYAFALALLLAPLARGAELRGILFALLAGSIQWLQMAFTRDAGGSVHHAILVWPLPAMVIALSFAAASRRLPRYSSAAAGAALAVVMVAGYLQINQYYRLTWRNGAGHNYTDAIYDLSDRLGQLKPSRVMVMDWGMMDSLRLLHHGRLPLAIATDYAPAGGPPKTDRIIQAASAEGVVFVAHRPKYEILRRNQRAPVGRRPRGRV